MRLAVTEQAKPGGPRMTAHHQDLCSLSSLLLGLGSLQAAEVAAGTAHPTFLGGSLQLTAPTCSMDETGHAGHQQPKRS